jgi:hypothetical protein
MGDTRAMGDQALAARLELVGAPNRGGALAYRIVNTGAARLLCGCSYRLERQDGSEWVAMNPGMAFRTIGFGVDPGNERQLLLSVPADAPPGHYRIGTSVRSEPPAAVLSADISTEFQLR